MNIVQRTSTAAAMAVLISLTAASSASAITITDGFTFSVGTDEFTTTPGTHFHSSTGGDFGNPAGKAEVGRFIDEEVRGLSEFDLSSLANSPTAFATFNVFNDGGLFTDDNDFPFNGTITVEAYVGNNAEDISDYDAPTTQVIGSFSTIGLSVGDTLSFDIAALFNDAIDNAVTSLGMRLRADPLNIAGAWTFDTFSLTTDDQTSTGNSVPEPGMLALFGVGIAGLGLLRRRRDAVSIQA